MKFPKLPLCTFSAALFFSWALMTAPAPALDGGEDVCVTGTSPGWKTFEIITGGDAFGGFSWTSQHDDFDGLGAYKHDSTTLRVFVNHEAGAGSTFSRVDLNLANLKTWIANGDADNSANNQVAAPGQIVKALSLGWTSIGSGTGALNNPCSGNVWLADTFGPGLGFADTLYMLGEESTGGHVWVMDAATRTLYEAPNVGGSGRWENASPIDTGRTDTIAILCSEDGGVTGSPTSALRLYVGLKNPAGNFLQRNGLSGGTTYVWNPDTTTSTDGTMGGMFSAGNGTVIPGTWQTSTSGAALFAKSEDVHTNMNPSSPGFGVEAVFASQEEAVFEIDCSQLSYVAGNLGANRVSDILVLFEENTDADSNTFTSMDNLVWSSDGLIYVNEDDGEGDIWVIDRDSLKASYAASDFTPSASQVFDVMDANLGSETSGILEISEYVGYAPGSVFLTASQSSTLTNNQIAMMVSPTAALLTYTLNYTAGAGGTLTGTTSQVVSTGGDGTAVTAVPDAGFEFVDWSDGVLTAARTDTNVMANLSVTANFAITSHYLVWISGYPSLTGGDTDPAADPELDLRINLFEYAFNLDPTVSENTVVAAGAGTAGMPLVEVRSFGPALRLVIEYIRRIDVTDLVYTPQFGGDLTVGGWGPGVNETVTPINSSFERVVIEDTVDATPGVIRFGRLEVEVTSVP